MPKISINKKILELSTSLIFLPSFIIYFQIQKLIIPILIITGFFGYLFLKKKSIIKSNENKKISLIFFIKILSISTLIITLTFLLFPERFNILNLSNYYLWFIFVFIYIFLIALPQEIIFREFFFYRYSSLFKSKNSLIFYNGIIFGFIHIVFLDILVIIISTIGGLIFAKNYYYYKSLFLVTLEHSIYGIIIFSIGLGYYFKNGYINYIFDMS